MRTTVLSAEMIPTGEISVEAAIVKIVLEKAYAVENYPDTVYRSQHEAIPAPRVIAMFRHVSLPEHFHSPPPLTNHRLFLRDRFECSYCGRHRSDLEEGEFLSRDHVRPLSRGGSDTWKNCVTACITCNRRKDDQTPREAEFPDPTPLQAPTRREIYEIRREYGRRVAA